MPSAEFESFLGELRKMPLDPDAGVTELRRVFNNMSEAVPPPPDARFEAVDAGIVKAEWTHVRESQGEAVLFFIHGGGYVFGAPRTHRTLVANICKATGLKGFSVDYRLSPEHPFPAAIDDCVTAYDWLIAQGTDPSGIVTAGDSAGGGLTLATLLALRDSKKPLPAAAVVLSPLTDQAQTGESLQTKAAEDPVLSRNLVSFCASNYLGSGESAQDPLASPLYGDLTGLPPTLVLVGSAELLLDDSLRWADKAKKAGVAVDLVVGPGMIHCWPFFAGFFPEADQAITTIATFIRRNLM